MSGIKYEEAPVMGATPRRLSIELEEDFMSMVYRFGIKIDKNLWLRFLWDECCITGKDTSRFMDAHDDAQLLRLLLRFVEWSAGKREQAQLSAADQRVYI